MRAIPIPSGCRPFDRWETAVSVEKENAARVQVSSHLGTRVKPMDAGNERDERLFPDAQMHEALGAGDLRHRYGRRELDAVAPRRVEGKVMSPEPHGIVSIGNAGEG